MTAREESLVEGRPIATVLTIRVRDLDQMDELTDKDLAKHYDLIPVGWVGMWVVAQTALRGNPQRTFKVNIGNWAIKTCLVEPPGDLRAGCERVRAGLPQLFVR